VKLLPACKRAVALAASLLAATSDAATLRGTVATGPHVAVWLEGGPPAAPRRASLEEVWVSFVPKVQVLPVGSTLVLANHDDESHTVHALLGNRTLFNLATVPKGTTQEVRLDQPGVVTFICDLHREMRAYVLVAAASFATVTDASGRFELANVPKGHYRVRIWAPPGSAHDDTERTALGELAATIDLDDATPPLALAGPPRVEPVVAARAPAFVPDAPLHTPRDYAPIIAGWPHTGWIVLTLAALGIVAGIAGAIGNLRIAARAGWGRAAGVLIGCALAVGSGLLIVVGLHGAIAIALGFGFFIGTAVFGAAEI
jgi:plastocyanin